MKPVVLNPIVKQLEAAAAPGALGRAKDITSLVKGTEYEVRVDGPVALQRGAGSRFSQLGPTVFPGDTPLRFRCDGPLQAAAKSTAATTIWLYPVEA